MPHERLRPRGQISGDVVPGFVVDRGPVLRDVLYRRLSCRVNVSLGRRDEDARETTSTGRVHLSGDRTVLVREESNHRGNELRSELLRARTTRHARVGRRRDEVHLDSVWGPCAGEATREPDDRTLGGRVRE